MRDEVRGVVRPVHEGLGCVSQELGHRPIGQCFSNLSLHQNHLEGDSGPYPRNSDPLGLGWGLDLYFSQVLDDAVAGWSRGHTLRTAATDDGGDWKIESKFKIRFKGTFQGKMHSVLLSMKPH